jgi:hypothetical protein
MSIGGRGAVERIGQARFLLWRYVWVVDQPLIPDSIVPSLTAKHIAIKPHPV